MTDRAFLHALMEVAIDVEVVEHKASLSRPDVRYFFNTAGEIVKIIGYEGGRRAWVADEKGRQEFPAKEGA